LHGGKDMLQKWQFYVFSRRQADITLPFVLYFLLADHLATGIAADFAGKTKIRSIYDRLPANDVDLLKRSLASSSVHFKSFQI
jgi:hypothetical protein